MDDTRSSRHSGSGKPGRTGRSTSRRLVQLYAALLYNAHLKGFVTGEIYTGNAKALCVPGLNCYSCPAATAACPLGALQNALAATGHRVGWYALGIVMLFGMTLGRTICGWLCPIGLIQDLLHRIPTPKLKKSPATRTLSWLKYALLIVFAVAIPLWFGLRWDMPLPAFCKYICPAGTLEGALGLLATPARREVMPMLGGLFTWKLAVLLVLVVACVFCRRAFCRFVCPLGAIYSLFSRVALTGVRVDAGRCNGCGACVRRCELDVRHVGDRECIHCGECMAVCAQGAISIRCGRVTLKGPETGPNAVAAVRRRRIAWAVALAVLIAALVGFNLPWQRGEAAVEPAAAQNAADGQAEEKAPPETADAEPESTDAPAGSSGPLPLNSLQGNALVPSASGTEDGASGEADSDADRQPGSLPLTGISGSSAYAGRKSAQGGRTDTGMDDGASADNGDTSQPAEDAVEAGWEVGRQLPDFSVTMLNGEAFRLSEHRGKAVFINLWATYCVPCIRELPDFERLRSEHPEAVIMAVHARLATADVAEWLADKGWELDFAVDVDGAVTAAVNGSALLPRTVVLDRRGVVIYNQTGAVTYEQLQALLEMAQSD